MSCPLPPGPPPPLPPSITCPPPITSPPPACPPPPPAPPSKSLPPPRSSTCKISPANLHKHLRPGPVSPGAALNQALDRFVKLNSSYAHHKFLCYYHHTNARLQEGPQCGIVALTIASSEGVVVEEVQQEARDR